MTKKYKNIKTLLMDEYKITKVKKIKCINKVLIELNTLLNFYLISLEQKQMLD